MPDNVTGDHLAALFIILTFGLSCLMLEFNASLMYGLHCHVGFKCSLFHHAHSYVFFNTTSRKGHPRTGHEGPEGE
jgi:hypothetical protein